jgi:hypothetical protein
MKPGKISAGKGLNFRNESAEKSLKMEMWKLKTGI